MAGKIQSPEKELRFTRSGQASLFWLAAAVLTATAVTLLASAWYRHINPDVPHPAWALLPFSFAAFMARTAIQLTRHAYLILTPLGIEIFPFFRPATGMRLVIWQEIDHAEVNPATTRLTLHHDAVESSGIHLSLTPIRRDRRSLLAKAVLGRLSPPAAQVSSGG
jgi:lysylphosphatidylglycerol synthetase-like protein (DUF2156 family)